MKCSGFSWFVLGLAASTLATPALHADFLAPGATVAGVSQAQLSAQWWQWALAYPASNNPLLDSTGQLASLGNQGNVFFLAGYAGPPNQGVAGKADRTATVTSSQTLFLPIINGFASTADGTPNIPQNALGTVVANLVGVPDQMSVTLTSESTGKTQTLGLSALLTHRQTAAFTATLPANNLDGVGPGTYAFASDGYWLAIAPLAPGVYDLTFTGHSVGHLPSAYGFDGSAVVNSQTISYQLTAQTPEPGACLLALVGGVPLLGGLWSRWQKRTGPSPLRLGSTSATQALPLLSGSTLSP